MVSLGDIVDGDGGREGNPGKNELSAVLAVSSSSNARVYHVPGSYVVWLSNNQGNHDFYLGGMTKPDVLKELGLDSSYYVLGERLVKHFATR